MVGTGGERLRGRPDLGMSAADRTFRRLSFRWGCPEAFGRRPANVPLLRDAGL